MSVLSLRPVADIVARRFAAKINAAIHPGGEPRFPEITIRTTDISIDTRHGPVAATIYPPQSPTGTPGVYVNAHGGGFVVGHRDRTTPGAGSSPPMPMSPWSTRITRWPRTTGFPRP